MLRPRFWFSLIAVLAMPCATTLAQQNRDSPENPNSTAAQKYFTDVLLETQDGKQVKFYSDLLQGKVVLINSFFAECKDSCPVMAGKLSHLQDLLGDRLGKDVLLLSFSVDPVTDTPEKLKAYAERFHAKPGWLFLTGKKENVDYALYKLGQKVDRKEDHMTLFIIGSEKTGLWRKVPAATTSDATVRDIVDCIVKDNCPVH
jgi:protein SCO1/2